MDRPKEIEKETSRKVVVESPEDLTQLCSSLKKDFKGRMTLSGRKNEKKYDAHILIEGGCLGSGGIVGASYTDLETKDSFYRDDALNLIKSSLKGGRGRIEFSYLPEMEFQKDLQNNRNALLDTIIPFASLGIAIKTKKENKKTLPEEKEKKPENTDPLLEQEVKKTRKLIFNPARRQSDIRKKREIEKIGLAKKIKDISRKKESSTSTAMDYLYGIIKENQIVHLDEELCDRIGVGRQQLENWLAIMEEQGLVKLRYPAIGRVEITSHASDEPGLETSGKEGGEPENVFEKYDVSAGLWKTRVDIVEKDYQPFYKIEIPDVDIGTKALLSDIKERLISAMDMAACETFDANIVGELRGAFAMDASAILREELPDLKEETRDFFTQSIVHELLGLGDIEFLLTDDHVEEIVVNSKDEPVRAYHKKHGWIKTNIYPGSEANIQNYANLIARRIGKEVTTLNPLLDAHLYSGDRVNATLDPVSAKGNTITIRKFSRDPWTITDYIKNKTISEDAAALIWLCMQHELNMIVSGGTGSGKTSLLNVCMPFIPPNQRIVSIEDTRELRLPHFLYWSPMITRQANPEGKGEISMLDILVNSLRMRPDRIVMGEMRRQREAEVLFEAMHTGHSVYATLHADDCEQTLTRLTNSPLNIPASMLDSVHLNVVMHRDRKKGIRRVLEIGELTQDTNTRQPSYYPTILYRWDPKNDAIEENPVTPGIYKKIGKETGQGEEEILKDLETKKKILSWLVRHDVRGVEDVGRVMCLYYLNRKRLTEALEADLDPKTAL